MPKQDESPLGAPCWVELFTSDADQAKGFYRELFGWTVQETGPEFGNYFNFSKSDSLVAGGMHNDGSTGQPDRWSVYLATADVNKTCDAATANGGQVIFPAMAVGDLGSMAVMTGPGGAAIGAWQPGLHKGFGLYAESGAPSWWELQTRDYDKAIEFYKQVFNWDAHAMSDTPEFRYTTLGEGDNARAGVMDAGSFLPEGVASHWSVYFGCDDTDASVSKALELGGAVVEPAEDTPYGRLATLTDPTGAVFKLVHMDR